MTGPISDEETAYPSRIARPMLPTANPMTTQRDVRYAWLLSSIFVSMSASALFTISLVSRSRLSASGVCPGHPEFPCPGEFTFPGKLHDLRYHLDQLLMFFSDLIIKLHLVLCYELKPFKVVPELMQLTEGAFKHPLLRRQER